jgi:hypothetical protein
MASHMTALGFPVSTESDFRHYTYQASEFGQTIEAFSGSYTLWAPGHGIELWVQTNLHKRIIGMNPHFNGRARIRTLLTRRIMRREHSILDGTFYGWINPSHDDPSSRAYPFVFDAPDYDLYNELELPHVANVQLAAFAHTLQGYDSEEAFKQAQEESTRCVPESFTPSGLFSSGPHRGHKESNQPQAIISGHVLATQKIVNPVTDQQFYWALVHIPGGEVDIVADPQVVQGKISVNGIVKGTFWLSGRLHLNESSI